MLKTHHAHLALWGQELAMPMITHMGTNNYRHAVKLEEHSHVGFELVFALKGSLAYELASGECIEIRGGQFSFMPPSVAHRGRGGYEAPCQFCWMIFNPRHRQAIKGTPFTREELGEIQRRYSSFETSVVDYSTNTRNALHRFRMAFYDHFAPTRSALSLPLLRSLACELIIDSSRHLEQFSVSKKSEYGKAAAEYVEARLFEPVSVNEIAAYLGFSVSRTHELFKDYTGQSPIDYHMRLRVRAAQKRLLAESVAVTRIAHECGFSSSQYFSRIFRRYVGLSPREYRRQGD
ncbi:helix-turn-helix domain-containing protein [Pelagicoccus sp. SDUM812005]|uniref:helix-turn-helix domain-containing protein n=1 Tax=Pelagicoccus sp. SDUM812005 TaxID=3041257 RepID=UPI00280E0DAC|nr:helix-turn-helix domain-containing protein [Pelagicoccus sp. SDUM812005]MDQ8180330.1 helix-turn-helix domain-containing protein [Pelagicoccus sp. SDUM812005]